jgi:hypothetical protein
MKINMKDISRIELTLNCAQQQALILVGLNHQALQKELVRFFRYRHHSSYSCFLVFKTMTI